MFQDTVRPLNDKEKRALALRLASFKADWIRFRRRFAVVAAGLCAVMTPVTVIAGNVSWAIGLTFWSTISALIGAWVWVEQVTRRRKRVQQIDLALRGGQVREVRVQASAVVELEEVEDEGACYAFDVGNGTVVFISGQEFYPSRTFPNADFSLIEVHDTEGVAIESYLEKRGDRLKISKTISAESRKRLRVPDHLERLDAPLVEIERVLARNGAK